MEATSGKRPRKRACQAIRPLTEEERELVLRNMGLAKGRAFKMGMAMAMRSVPNLKGPSVWRRAMQYMDELIDGCYIGLCVAAQFYDPLMGSFSNYAYRCIRTFCCRASIHAKLKVMPQEQRKDFDNCNVDLLSDLDGSVDLAESPSDEPADSEHLALLKRTIDGLLSPREAKIFYLRAAEGLLLEEIGQMQGVTRERIRQIEKRAIGKLRRNGVLADSFYEYGRNKNEVRRHEAGDVVISTSERR